MINKISNNNNYEIFYRAMPIRFNSLRDDDFITKSLRFAKIHAESSSVYEGEDYGVYQFLLNKSEYIEHSNPGEYKYIGDNAKRCTLVGIAKYNDDMANSVYQAINKI